MFQNLYLYSLRLVRNIWLLSVYHFHGPPADILRRFSWEGFQTLLGWWIAFVTILRYKVTKVQYYDGAIVLQVKRKELYWGGVSFGSVILGDSRIDASLNNILFMHEFGHCLQSRISGPTYLFKFGLPSLRSVTVKGHNLHPVEQDANFRARQYFSKLNGFKGWPQNSLPILEHAVCVKIYWWEYLPPLFPIVHLYQLLGPVRRLPEKPS